MPAKKYFTEEEKRQARKLWNKRRNDKRRTGDIGPYTQDDGTDWKERNRQHYLAEHRKNGKKIDKKRRMKALHHYGGTPPSCYCCGEREPLFLGIDHIKGGGREEKRNMKNNSLADILHKRGYPDGYRVACHSCNLGSHLNGGTCPHQTRGERNGEQEGSL